MAGFHLIDTHAHLDMERFDPDRAQVILRAHSAGVDSVVAVGIDLPSSRAALLLSQENQGIYPAVGIHPQETKRITPPDMAELASLASTQGVVAIGEIGLDYFHDNSPHTKQLEVLEYQLGLAARLDLPVLLHCRAAEDDFIHSLENWVREYRPTRPGIVHCFSGSLANARTYLEMGFCLGLGGYIGYPSSKGLREVVKEIPLASIVLETDSPFLPPQSQRGLRNEPSYIAETARELAKLKGLSLEEVARATTETATTVFDIAKS